MGLINTARNLSPKLWPRGIAPHRRLMMNPDFLDRRFPEPRANDLDRRGTLPARRRRDLSSVGFWSMPRLCSRSKKQGANSLCPQSRQAKDSGYFYGHRRARRGGRLVPRSPSTARPIPDLASHFNPAEFIGPSMVVDAEALTTGRRKTGSVRPWNGHVVYECHIGTFTPEGTFQAAIENSPIFLRWESRPSN